MLIETIVRDAIRIALDQEDALLRAVMAEYGCPPPFAVGVFTWYTQEGYSIQIHTAVRRVVGSPGELLRYSHEPFGGELGVGGY